MEIIFGPVLAALLGWAGLAEPAQPPANPHANAKARAVLKFFQGLEARPDRRLVSGQFADFGEGANLKLVESVHDRTGHWPALIGVDYADFARGKLTHAAPNRTAIAYARQGGLVQVSAHLYNPAKADGGGLRDAGVDLAALLDTNSPTHARWLTELDELAAGLQELKEAGVVVLWRPFHEMNGGWFWWGAKEPEKFIRVWRQMFDYFTETKRLDNLLWVYGPNHGERTAAYYAGDRYVDLVGLDAYTDFIDPAHIRGYAEVARLPKPFGFSEYGPHGPANPPGDYDYRLFLAGVRANFPRTVYFMSWNDRWSLASNRAVKEFLDDPRLVNRENLPAPGGARN